MSRADVATEDTWARAVAHIRADDPASIGLVTSAAILDVGYGRGRR